jgi:hypothetical protein
MGQLPIILPASIPYEFADMARGYHEHCKGFDIVELAIPNKGAKIRVSHRLKYEVATTFPIGHLPLVLIKSPVEQTGCPAFLVQRHPSTAF